MSHPVRVPVVSETTAERLRSATIVLIDSREIEKGIHVIAKCAGVWVSKTEFITAAHCVRPDSESAIKILGLFKITLDPIGTEHDFLIHSDLKNQSDESRVILKSRQNIRIAKVIAYDQKIDLALLTVKHEFLPIFHPIIPIFQGQLRIGNSVRVIGHTSGYWWTYTQGVVAAIRNTSGPFDDPLLILQISAPVWFGNSGGGVFTEDGQLIGLSSFVSTRGPSLSFFIHRNLLNKFLISHGITS